MCPHGLQIKTWPLLQCFNLCLPPRSFLHVLLMALSVSSSIAKLPRMLGCFSISEPSINNSSNWLIFALKFILVDQ